jgi:hypothetical protein
MKIKVSSDRAEMEGLIGALESVEHLKEARQGLPLIEFNVDRLPTAGAESLFIRFQPTERLMELVTAVGASEIERRVP